MYSSSDQTTFSYSLCNLDISGHWIGNITSKSNQDSAAIWSYSNQAAFSLKSLRAWNKSRHRHLGHLRMHALHVHVVKEGVIEQYQVVPTVRGKWRQYIPPIRLHLLVVTALTNTRVKRQCAYDEAPVTFATPPDVAFRNSAVLLVVLPFLPDYFACLIMPSPGTVGGCNHRSLPNECS